MSKEKCDLLSDSEYRQVRHSALDASDRVEKRYGSSADAQGALAQLRKEAYDYSSKNKCWPHKESFVSTTAEMLSNNNTGILPVLQLTELQRLVKTHGKASKNGDGRTMTVAEVEKFASQAGRKESNSLTTDLVHFGMLKATKNKGSSGPELSERSLKADINRAKAVAEAKGRRP